MLQYTWRTCDSSKFDTFTRPIVEKLNKKAGDDCVEFEDSKGTYSGCRCSNDLCNSDTLTSYSNQPTSSHFAVLIIAAMTSSILC